MRNVPGFWCVIVVFGLLGCATDSKLDWSRGETRRETVVTQRSVVTDHRPILYVLRDSVNGQWMFLTGENPPTDLQITVTIDDILKIDESIKELADLSPGWVASRAARGTPWTRRRL